MVQIEVRVCDICQRVNQRTDQYTITQSHRSSTVDLCEEHGKWLEELLPEKAGPPPVVERKPRKAAPTPVAAPVRRGRRSGVHVTTLAQIEAEKAAQPH